MLMESLVVLFPGGVAWKVPATPFYNTQLRPSASDLLLHQMHSIICKPQMW